MVQNIMRLLPVVGGGLAALLGAGLVAYLIASPQESRTSARDARAQAEQPQLAQATDEGNAEQASADDEPPNAIARQAREWGISRCSRQIALVSEFLTRNSVFSARSMHGPHEADEEVFSATIVARAQNDGAQTVSTMTVAPVSAGRCNVVYETTAHFAADCEAVRQARFSNFAEPVEFGDLARAYATSGGDGQLYMLSTGEGCLVKKTQSLY